MECGNCFLPPGCLAYLAARREKPQGPFDPPLPPPENGETISSLPPPWQ